MLGLSLETLSEEVLALDGKESAVLPVQQGVLVLKRLSGFILVFAFCLLWLKEGSHPVSKVKIRIPKLQMSVAIVNLFKSYSASSGE